MQTIFFDTTHSAKRPQKVYNKAIPNKKVMNIRTVLTVSVAAIVLATGSVANAQNNRKNAPQRSVYQVNSLDVMYYEDDYESVGAADYTPYESRRATTKSSDNRTTATTIKNNDTSRYKRTEHYLKKKMFEKMENEYNDDESDPGAESEMDILYASFDTNAIHYSSALNLKTDTNVVLHLLSGNKAKFVCPLTDFHISSRFGPRRRRFHYGIDLAMPTGTPVYAAFDGKVRVAKRNKSYGNLIVIRHNNGLETYYAHLSKIEVQSGQEVKAGDQIGLVGNTGRSFGSHLHFETRYLGSAMNPEAVVDFSEKKLVSEDLAINSTLFRHKNSNAQIARSSAAKSGGKYHTVRKGDTLGAIAARNHTSVKRLCQLNGIRRTSTLRLGQKIRVR